ncbi:MAG TPA: hypothetical protein VGH54_22120 [Mycobacterium sp.]|uniref:hypothetical protein n=1 Tax=Mycobacterium sp. TaxID=1785 RepID=UPI002F4014F4
MLAKLVMTLALVGLVLGLNVEAAWADQPTQPQSRPTAPTALLAAVNPNCTLVVPPNPLSAGGLGTPYELTATDRRQGPCHEANPAQSAFVEATILDPATGQVTIYRPLVIDRGTRPAIQTVVPTVPAGAVVGLWFGFQGNTLTLAHGYGCVNGLFGSPFGQFAYCNAPAFFKAAHAAVAAGLLQVPPLGTGNDGLPCPSTRDFSVVDQDQSDNVLTRYVALGDGQTGQDTGALPPGATFLTNGSDNGLLTNFVAPALGCTSFTAPDQTAGGRVSTSLALNELQAEAQGAPVALVPPNDPMALFNNRFSFPKMNLYRLGVNQPPAFQTIDAAYYCQNLLAVAPARLIADRTFEVGKPSPDIAMAPDLATFLQVRFAATLVNLHCPTGTPPGQNNNRGNFFGPQRNYGDTLGDGSGDYMGGGN